MTHAPEEIETMARLLCEADGIEADLTQPENRAAMLNLYTPRAIRALDALQAKGWKITATDEAQNSSAILQWHRSAPICPREDK